jgi:RNA polymerase sigma-70 factor (TIGR02952 family)
MTVDCLSPEVPAVPDPGDPRHEVWDWVSAAQKGDTEAFGRIYDRYVDTVFRFIYFRVGNRPLAEDLMQETFLRALKRIDSFTWQGRDLGAWLVTIARNLVADHFKSGRYRLEVTTGDVLDADPEGGPEGSPESAVVDHIANVTLLSAVKQLNPEQQECIIYRFLKGYSVLQTATAMGKNEGAIKALQYRAVRALFRLLDLADPHDPAAGFTLKFPDAPPVLSSPLAVRAVEPAAQLAVDPAPAADNRERVPVRHRVDWTPGAIRRWARSVGMPVPTYGPLPPAVREAYTDAVAPEVAA